MSTWSPRWMASEDERPAVGLPALLVVAAATPLATASAGVWVDEAITLRLVARWSLVELLTVLPVQQPHLPTWYVLLELLGPGGAQAVSWVSLPLTAYATYRLAELLEGPRAGLWAGALVATSPYLATQASWLRMYALLTAALTWGVWLAYESRYRSATAAMLLGASLHPFGVFGPAWLGYRLVRTGRATRGRLAAVVAGLLPLVAVLSLHIGPSGFTERSTKVAHATAPNSLELVLTPIAVLTGAPWAAALGVLPVAGLLFVAIWWWPDADLAVWVVVPVAAVGAASVVLHPVFGLKYFGFVAPAVAAGLMAADRPRWTHPAVLALFAVLYLTGWSQWLAGMAIAQRLHLIP